MLTFKIRVGYKNGGAKTSLEKIQNYISDHAVIEGYQILDDCIEIYVMKPNEADNTKDLVLDVRQLDIFADPEYFEED